MLYRLRLDGPNTVSRVLGGKKPTDCSNAGRAVWVIICVYMLRRVTRPTWRTCLSLASVFIDLGGLLLVNVVWAKLNERMQLSVATFFAASFSLSLIRKYTDKERLGLGQD